MRRNLYLSDNQHATNNYSNIYYMFFFDEGFGNEHFFRVSISAPERRAALTAFSSFLAAAVGAFLRRTTGSQSWDRGPTPDMAMEWICLGFFVFVREASRWEEILKMEMEDGIVSENDISVFGWSKQKRISKSQFLFSFYIS